MRLLAQGHEARRGVVKRCGHGLLMNYAKLIRAARQRAGDNGSPALAALAASARAHVRRKLHL